MSRLDNFIRSLASPVSKGERNVDPDDTAGDARRRSEWRRRRRRYNSGDGVVEKQSVDRRAQAFAAIEQSVVEKGGMRKPYDPLFLRDISANAVVQAYVDTLAQDVASASWKLKARDEDANIDGNTLAQAERTLRDLHPELPFRDVLEETARILLELGDATWVKHYFEGTNDLAEVVVVDSSTMFKDVDDHGITDGYIQASRRNRDVANPFDTDEVVWFSWSLRPDRHYGQGPLEKAQNEVELLEELAEKERLDLIAGSNPGVISPDYNDEFGGTVPDEDWDTFVEQMQLDEGERHRVGYSKIPVDFEPITANYQELQVLERSRYWVTVLGSVFKVNPSYAGFEFENVNRATDESQQEAFRQRGFRVTLRQLEEAINRQLIWQDFSDDIKFEFEREQTADEKERRASLIREQAEAGQEMAEALEGDEDDDDAPEVHFRDGELIVDDGKITPSEDTGENDGLFFSASGGSGTLTKRHGQHRLTKTPSGVPENANGPVDPSDIPDGAQTYNGPQGGTYWLPADEEPEAEDGFITTTPGDTPPERDVVDVPVSDGGLRDVPDTDDPDELARSIPTVDERFEDELAGVPASPPNRLSQEDEDATYDAVADFVGNMPDEIQDEFISRMSHIGGETDDDRPNMTRGSAGASQQKPGEGNEMGFITVTNPSAGDRVVHHEAYHALQYNMGYEGGGESAGASGGFQEYDSPTDDNPDAKPIEDALLNHENEDAPVLPEGESPDEIMESVEVGDDGYPETASFDEVGDALTADYGDTAEERFRRWQAEANKAFLKTQGVKDREGEDAARSMVARPYQMTNVNEFTAVTNGTLQSGSPRTGIQDLARNHPELVGAYLSVFDVPEETQEVLETYL